MGINHDVCSQMTSMRWTSWIKNFPLLSVGLGEEGNYTALFLGEQSLSLIKGISSYDLPRRSINWIF